MESNGQRLAKNTLLLYFRMALTMVVSLFTSRVVLDAMGVDNFGIYHVVGGVVSMFIFISGSLSNAVSRFITVELGRGDMEKLKRIFSTSVVVQVLLALAIAVLAEAVGLWFVHCKMNLPEGRLAASCWVLHCSILTFAVNLISVPYNAAIIAHEKMSAFAYISIAEVGLKLLVAYLLYVATADKLIVYAVLLLFVSVFIRWLYNSYCVRHFEECRMRWKFDRTLMGELSSFAGWNLLGNVAFVMNNYGINFLINIFFGVVVNAANGIAHQVNAAVQQFVNSFMTALNPQITKSYAAGDYGYTERLINRGTKYSFFIMLIPSLPILFETESILRFWLHEVPYSTVEFVQCIILQSLVLVLGNPLLTGVMAVGRIKRYSIVSALIALMVFPISWVGYRLGMPPYAYLLVYAGIYFSLNGLRLLFLRRHIQYSVRRYAVEVLGSCAGVTFLSVAVPWAVVACFDATLARMFANVALSMCAAAAVAFYVGLSRDERERVLAMAKRFFVKRKS